MDKRASFRFPTDLEADCRSCDRSWKSRLRNVSIGGCMIECPESGVPAGSLLRLRIKGVPAIDGVIAWQHRGHAGIRFGAPLQPALLEELAFRGAEGISTGLPESVPERPAHAPRRPLPGLHGQLIKRQREIAEEPPPDLARAG